MKRKAVFLDRDGTIIEDCDYLSDPERVRLIGGAAEAIRELRKAGYFIVMVSNQSGVARGMFALRAVEEVNARVREELAAEGARLDASYYCPHYEKGSVPKYSIVCRCRKPLPGMAQSAASEHALELSESYMIGDKGSDVEFGRNCGMKNAFLVSTGHGAEQTIAALGYGTRVRDIGQAAEIILGGGS